ncbi:hypothetical protein Ssi02_59290 [Sinosporangium siamense]|uniref:Uncharacterized protein n=1 Tax=Sinosporangium siamense TaxID=1367973 RepID=A0A919RKZ1_9ACTN|nr:hypothetical protein Ssi02_59290 [Sinosporangium siamense]
MAHAGREGHGTPKPPGAEVSLERPPAPGPTQAETPDPIGGGGFRPEGYGTATALGGVQHSHRSGGGYGTAT